MTNTHPHAKARILIVDDDATTLEALERLLRQEGHEVHTAKSGQAALEIAASHPPDVVVTDVNMPGMTGYELLERLHAQDRDLPVVVTTGAADLSAAVSAMRKGAEDFIPKPIDMEVLSLVIDRVQERRAIKVEAENLRRQLRERQDGGLEGLVGTSPAMQKVYRAARQVAGSRATVLVTGESGTGKGELARAIHAMSPRAQKPFVSLHCAALTETLLESELFGHERGSFTGAEKRRIGRFEQADGGTLFLDEVGEIPMSMQVKLLRVLQERTFERVGGNESIHVDVRVIAATNRDLAADVAAGRFREDLYYRLNVVRIDMPPLRLRGGDTMALANHFLRKYAQENGKAIVAFDDSARERILANRWAGNVRALENAIERAVVLASGPHVTAEELPVEEGPVSAGGLRIPGSTMAEIERYAILKTLEAVNGSTHRAAEILGISIRTIQYRLHEYGVAKPTRQSAATNAA